VVQSSVDPLSPPSSEFFFASLLALGSGLPPPWTPKGRSGKNGDIRLQNEDASETLFPLPGSSHYLCRHAFLRAPPPKIKKKKEENIFQHTQRITLKQLVNPTPACVAPQPLSSQPASGTALLLAACWYPLSPSLFRILDSTPASRCSSTHKLKATAPRTPAEARRRH
jgi:hypothetical protein